MKAHDDVAFSATAPPPSLPLPLGSSYAPWSLVTLEGALVVRAAADSAADSVGVAAISKWSTAAKVA